MKSLNSIAVVISLTLLLGACSNTPSATNSDTKKATESTPSVASSIKSNPIEKAGEHGEGHGGQVVETGPYHLELSVGKEGDTTHLDFFLLKGDKHDPVTNAKVTAQLTLPDGNSKIINLTYNPTEKHYEAVLPSTAIGEYKAAVISDIAGEKVNGRFTFRQ